MTNRIDNAKAGAENAVAIIGILYDALAEAADLMRAQSSDDGIALVKEFERRGLVQPKFGKGNPPVAATPADRLVAWLTGPNPEQYGPAKWSEMSTLRMNLIQIIASDSEKARQSVDKPALQGWFVGQLSKTGFDYHICGKLVTNAFMALAK